jgi:hypothetical protein
VTDQRLLERPYRWIARVVAIATVALVLVPASASARPGHDAGADQQQVVTGDLDWCSATLAAGAVALLVAGALGMAAADDRRYLPPGG